MKNKTRQFSLWKLATCLFIIFAILGKVAVLAQEIDYLDKKIKFEDMQVLDKLIIEKLKSVEGVLLSYNESALELGKKIQLPAKELTVLQVLEVLKEQVGISHQLHGKQLILKKSQNNSRGGQHYIIKGQVKEQSTGAPLFGATVQLLPEGKGTVTDMDGQFEIGIPSGEQILVFNYIGFEKVEKPLDVKGNMTVLVELGESASQLEEIVVMAKSAEDNVALNRVGFNTLEAKKMEKIPALFGEADPIKVIRLLPGVAMTSEISSAYSVRGGGHDQNLVLLDNAVVYNPSHLLGIFSTFNNDALQGIEFYKGNLPARHGGRLSSLLDVSLKEGSTHKFTGKGGVSPIASRLTLEIPTVKDKGSVVLSGRRTYADLFTGLANDEALQSSTLFFYDFNVKSHLKLDDKNMLYLSGYMGRDKFGVELDGFSPSMDWGNIASAFRWKHIYHPKLVSNLSLTYSKYDYHMGFRLEDFVMDWRANLVDYGLRMDFDYFLSADHSIGFGVTSTLHDFNPGNMQLQSSGISGSIQALESKSLEHAVYLGTESSFANGRFLINPGLRLSGFQNVGPYTFYSYGPEYAVTDTTQYSSGEVFNTYVNLEPRLALTYRINPGLSVKSGYARSVQYLHLASNSIGGTPLDVWVPSTPNVKPQKSDQYSVGLFQNLFNNKIETSVEYFYKYMTGQIDFKDHADILLNEQLEGEFRFGKGYASGVELMVSKPEGRLNGWISYTFSESMREIDGVNDGELYRSPFDRPHNLAVVANYVISPRIELSANWVYFSGMPFTVPSGKYYYQDNMIPIYTERNGDRMPDYKRLDLSLTLKGKDQETKKVRSSWNFSIYNVLNQKNPSFIDFQASESNPGQTQAVMYYLLPILPSISWLFEF